MPFSWAGEGRRGLTAASRLRCRSLLHGFGRLASPRPAAAGDGWRGRGRSRRPGEPPRGGAAELLGLRGDRRRGGGGSHGGAGGSAAGLGRFLPGFGPFRPA